MCYNSCPMFHFNPMTGEDYCSLPKTATCPDEPPEEEETENEEPEDGPGA